MMKKQVAVYRDLEEERLQSFLDSLNKILLYETATELNIKYDAKTFADVIESVNTKTLLERFEHLCAFSQTQSLGQYEFQRLDILSTMGRPSFYPEAPSGSRTPRPSVINSTQSIVNLRGRPRLSMTPEPIEREEVKETQPSETYAVATPASPFEQATNRTDGASPSIDRPSQLEEDVKNILSKALSGDAEGLSEGDKNAFVLLMSYEATRTLFCSLLER